MRIWYCDMKYDATNLLRRRFNRAQEKAYVIDSSGLVMMSSQRNVSNLALNNDLLAIDRISFGRWFQSE